MANRAKGILREIKVMGQKLGSYVEGLKDVPELSLSGSLITSNHTFSISAHQCRNPIRPSDLVTSDPHLR